MSDALNYLTTVRGEAMQSYFGFLKSAGRHLDPKTRALISVITKVDSRTETGFRQYLPRALRAGASADEILDALLCAFPTLGLTKIVWAIDILLDMDLPEFRPDRLGAAADWHDVAAIDDLPEGRTVCIGEGEQRFFVYREGETLRVFGSRCPHQMTAIPETALDSGILTCPKHRWKFDARSGECIEKGDRPLSEQEWKIEDGRLWVFS
ncbi:MAG: Rieske 2Fe-2S domain-containing protein [Gammaproteobacteria bacterium]|jgi:nitrite reductase/ring-hydroxylating ferredoxin subunit/alkylhydroperoxidase/carboxymuconolactone decarboxylase family protein YurZ